MASTIDASPCNPECPERTRAGRIATWLVASPLVIDRGRHRDRHRGGSHFQSVWFGFGPEPFPALAQYDTLPDLRNVDAQVVTTFPKGRALSQWLLNTGASGEAGEVRILGAQHNIVAENPEYAQRWIETFEPVPSVQYISANTPLGASDSEQCGRLVLSDIHVSYSGAGDDNSDSNSNYDFPKGCVTTEFTPQEAILAFMLFDISGCVVPDDQTPVAPPTILR